jgi:hypothetical protein
MRGRPDCTECHGVGSIVTGRFPNASARICACVKGANISGVPERFRQVDMEEFRRWWLDHVAGLGENGIPSVDRYNEVWDLYSVTLSGAFGPVDSCDNAASVRLLKEVLGPVCDPSRERLEACAMPYGLARALDRWVPGDRGENLWVHGASSSGKTGLAVALMRARCEAKNCSGAYASALAVGDALKAYYNRTVGAGTWSERIGMVKDPSELYGGLVGPDCLVLDMIDCLPQDKRVVENFVNVLAERFNANKVTIFTAFDTSMALQSAGKHPFCACDVPGTLAMSRLAACHGIQMVPALSKVLGQRCRSVAGQPGASGPNFDGKIRHPPPSMPR